MSIATFFARQYVAGRHRNDLIKAIRDLEPLGLKVMAHHLGAPAHDITAARRATESYASLIRNLKEPRLGGDANCAISLIELGLDIEEKKALENLFSLCDIAKNNFLWVDAETVRYTERILHFVRQAHKKYRDRIGVTLQANLFRTEKDIRDMCKIGISVRLVKGAPPRRGESPIIAFQSSGEINQNFQKLAATLLRHGREPAFVTHDETMIEFIKKFASMHHLFHHQYEFQFLYGVRDDLQKKLAADSYRVRVSVPYGPSVWPYFIQRLREKFHI